MVQTHQIFTEWLKQVEPILNTILNFFSKNDLGRQH